MTQEVDHDPKEKVINYLSFPILGMMTEHLKSWDAADILLIEPNLIKRCPLDIRSKTFQELIPENTYLLLQRKAPQELQGDLKIGNNIPSGWNITSITSKRNNNNVRIEEMDRRTIESLTHWTNVTEARKNTLQTGTGAKIQQWLQNNKVHS